MNTLETLEKRKSIRGYLNQPVETEKLNTILKYGNKAPNAGPFHMSVIRNPELLKEINDTVISAALQSGNEFFKQRLAVPGYQPLYGAPVLIILSAPEQGYGAVNTACAVTNMSIAATELGLGSCYLAGVLMAFGANPELAEKVGIPVEFKPQCGMILGYESSDQISGKVWPENNANINYCD